MNRVEDRHTSRTSGTCSVDMSAMEHTTTMTPAAPTMQARMRLASSSRRSVRPRSRRLAMPSRLRTVWNRAISVLTRGAVTAK